jgi:hypothetical protein
MFGYLSLLAFQRKKKKKVALLFLIELKQGKVPKPSNGDH